MKRLLILCFFIGAFSSYAFEPAQVTVDTDFNVGSVVDRLDEHISNVENWYAISKRCARKTQRLHPFDMGMLKIIVNVAHPAMIMCFNEMEVQQTLDPLFALWQEFKVSYSQSSGDQLLCKEIAFLATHLYNTMLCQLQRSGTRVTVTQMLELYHAIAALPIYELLSLLDSIAQEIIALLEQTYQGEDSFFVWLWHNWWLPPTVISHAVSSLLEGIAQIMIAEKPENAGHEKEDGTKTALVRAHSH